MQDLKTGEGGLLQVTLEGINLKFMHNQVGYSGGRRLPAPALQASSVQVPPSANASQASGAKESIRAAGPEGDLRGGRSDTGRPHPAKLRQGGCARGLGRGGRGPAVDSAQCEWERPPALVAFPCSRVCFCLWFRCESLGQLVLWCA